MKLTKKWLEKKEACEEGVEWFMAQKERDVLSVLKALMKGAKLDWANWLIVRVMERPQYLAYAIYAAEQVIDVFESKYPGDKRPRKAIKAAKAVLRNDTEETRAAAWAAYAAYAAWAAAWDARAAWAAAWAARAARAAGAAMKRKIIEYGIGLLERGGQR